MRLLTFLMILMFTTPCHAGPVNSVHQAWDYLAKANKGDRWVVIASTRNKGYFQCENMDTFVLCSLPVWARTIPGSKLYAPADSRRKPFPDVPGSKIQRYLTAQQVAAAKQAFRQVRVKPADVYSRLKSKEEKIIGTSYDVRVVLEFDFKGFDKLVDSYMRAVWNTSAQDGYTFETAD